MYNRKIIRGIFRNEAKEMGVKPSKWVNREFNRYQITKYGLKKRKINQAKGTHRRDTFKNRIEFALMNK